MDIKGRVHALRANKFLRSLALLNCFKMLPKFVQAFAVARLRLFDDHWLRHGCDIQGLGRYRAALFFARQGRGSASAAHPLFDAGWYCSRYEFPGTPAEALLHYWLVGDRIGLRPHAWFDPRLFRLRYALPFWGATALELFMRNWQRYPFGHPHFEAHWYLEKYPDVRLSGQNPLVHFVHFGLREGRQPNRYFLPSWYLEQNADVVSSGMPAALHFCLYGANELRNPGPNFDSIGYASRHANMTEAGYPLDPLAHYLMTGRAQGADTGPSCLYSRDLIGTHSREQQEDAPRLDVVIPVYRGLEETRVCIRSVIESESFKNMRLRIYNDCSPEPEVTFYLRSLASDYPQIILVENQENLGFVGTVNSAIRAAMNSEDFSAVVLLNSDTEVANDWLWRLHWHTTTNERVASVTALSNNATICSYPHLGANEMPAGMDVAVLDAMASSVNAGMSVEVPTGVGFCMLITRQALGELGLFDQDAFGRGYGEENDFCMRALQAGFRNLLALDVFVRHVGEVSFAESSKPGKIVAEKVLTERYPDYVTRVGAFVARDPSLTARLRLTFSRWRASPDGAYALFTHSLGGGTERYVSEEVSRLSAEGPVVVVRPVKNQKNRIRIENVSSFDGFDAEVSVDDSSDLAALLITMGVRKVRVHHVLGFGDLVRRGLAIADLEYDFMVHDYYSICPQITLTTERSRYCGEPGPEACDACISARPSLGSSDIRNWRLHNEWLVSGAKNVYAPSEDASARIERYFGIRPEVRYHESESSLLPVGMPGIRRHETRAPYRIAIIGALANHKGRQVVLDAAEAVRKQGIPLQFHLIGDPLGPVPVELRAKIQWTGPYKEHDLVRLIGESRVDAFLFAATSPETYSYTLSSAMRTGLPIIATAIGAFPERLANYSRARLVPWDIDGAQLAREVVGMLDGYPGGDA